MNDYRLDGLSPRLFEHLVQSLAFTAISSTITPFGDGPDGGREATFDGVTQYGAPGGYWNGNGILQAKYHVRPQDTRRDATWARGQLTSELKQYTRKRNRRPVPEYYIFATNVTLSPGEGGGKDSVLSILTEFAETHSVKGFDVWDYDKIRVLLDNNEQVRNSYLAWISSSDVLAQLSAMLRTRERDYYPLILKYLQRELLADQYAQLEQAGHSGDDAIPLSQVFIDLPTSFRPPSTEPESSREADTPNFVATIIADASTSLRAANEPSTELEGRAFPGSSSKNRMGRYVLIGGPGQGKTTIGQYICQIFRSSLLRDAPANRLSQDALNAVVGLTQQRKGGNYLQPRARRLPFRIVLGDLAKVLAAGDINSLLGYLAFKFSANTDVAISAEEIENMLRKYPSLIVLDGLDEVPPSTNRDAVITAVANFSIDIATSDLDVMIIATSRPQGYSDEFSPKQYLHHYLMPLSKNVALAYGSQLAKIRFGVDTERTRKVTERLSRAVTNRSTARLMTTPLQVTILTLLVDRIGQPPEERWALFNAYYRLIFERETERDITSVAVLREHAVDVDAIHRRVGMALQVESERSGGTDARLSEAQFGEIVEGYLREEGHGGRELHELKDRIIDAAANRLVFLVGLESGLVGFEIRSLQEFMAGEGLLDGPDVVVRDRLAQVAASSHWRNVFLFAAGKCFEQRRYLWDTIEAICFELNDDVNDSFRQLLVGSVLALDLLEDGPARKQPTKRRSLTRLALELLQRPVSDSRRLADVCHVDTCHIYLEKIQQELAGSDELDTNSTAVSAWRCLAFLIDRFGGDFERLGREVIAKRGLTVRVLRMTVDAATGRNQWLSEMLRDRLLEVGPELDSILLSHRVRRNRARVVQLGPWAVNKDDELLSWFAEFIDRAANSPAETNVRIIADNKALVTLGIPLLRQPELAKRLVPPTNSPTSSGWQFARKAGYFIAQPSSDSLTDAVKCYLDSARAGRAYDRLLFRYPWQLSECISAAREDREQVIRALDEGRFGDLEDWVSIERTLAEGVTLDYLMSLNPVSGDRQSGVLYQFPFRAHLYLESMTSSQGSELALIRAFEEADSAIVRKFLANLLVDSSASIRVSTRTDTKRTDNNWVDRILQVAMFPIDDDLIYPMFYNLLPMLHLEDPTWHRLFASVPLSVFGSPAKYPTGGSLQRLWEYVENGQGSESLLVPIAAAMSNWDPALRRSIIRKVSVPKSASPAVRVAALLVNIASGACIDEFEDEIRWAVTERVSLFNGIATAIVTRERPYEDECRELLALISITSPPLTSSQIALQRNYLRRQSNLSDGSVWDRLQLPRGVLGILDS